MRCQLKVEIRWEDILNDDETGRVYMFHMDVEEEAEDWERNASEPTGETGEAVGPGMEVNSGLPFHLTSMAWFCVTIVPFQVALLMHGFIHSRLAG